MEKSEDKGSDKNDESSNLNYLENDDNKDDDDPDDSIRRPTDKNKGQVKKTVSAPLATKKDKAPEIPEGSTEGIFLYKPGVQLPNLFPFIGQQIKIIIASEYISKNNPQYIKRNIYGSEAYTSNSDAFCVAVHSEKLNLHTFSHKRNEGIELTCKITRPKKTYIGALKNGLNSRSIKGYDGNALKPESVKPLTTLGPLQTLQKYAANMHIPIGTKRIKQKPRNISSVIPIPETHIVFNMNNEPAYKYSLFNIADRGFERSEWVIKRLDSNVLYLEGQDVKYELLKSKGVANLESQKDYFDTFRFSIVRNPQKIDNDYMAKNPPPLAQQQIEILFSDLDWQEILWGNSSIQVRGRDFANLRSFKYYKMDGKRQ